MIVKAVLIIILWLATSVCLCLAVEAAPAVKTAAKRHPVAQQKSLTIKSPNGKYSLVLSAPVKGEFGLLWQKIDLLDKNGSVFNAANALKDEPGSGAYELAETNPWSPDGKYVVLIHNIYGNAIPKQDGNFLLDCENGVPVDFKTAAGTSADIANWSQEWAKGKPHSMLILDENGKNAEALPPKI